MDVINKDLLEQLKEFQEEGVVGLLAPGATSVPSAYGYPRPELRRRPWR